MTDKKTMTVSEKIYAGHYYHGDRNKWRSWEEAGRLNERFKHDALGEVGLLEHPDRDAVWSKAWEENTDPFGDTDKGEVLRDLIFAAAYIRAKAWANR